MEEAAKFTVATKRQRLLLGASWVVALGATTWFWFNGDPHTVWWVPALFFLLLHWYCESFSYVPRVDKARLAQLCKLRDDVRLWAFVGLLICISLCAIAFFPGLFLGLTPGKVFWILGLLVGVYWLSWDLMIISGRFHKPLPVKDALQTPSELSEEERFVCAPLKTRAWVALGLVVWICAICWWREAIGIRLSYLVVGANRWFKDWLGTKAYEFRRSVPASKRLRELRIGTILIAGAVGACLAWLFFDLLWDASLKEGSRPPTFGMAWLILFGFSMLALLFASDVYDSGMVIIGWYRKDVLAKAADAEKTVRIADEPKRTCIECGLTLRRGRMRCHFCGGSPVPLDDTPVGAG